MFTFPAGTTISANDFLLISEFDKTNSGINLDPDLIAGTGSDNNGDFPWPMIICRLNFMTAILPPEF